ncbi:MAG: hypothetical protein ABGW84_02890 [Sphingomonadaceae bacterium]
MITSSDGGVETEAFFAGYGSSEEIILPPGEYNGRLEEIFSGNTTRRFSLTLPDEDTGTIELGTIIAPPADDSKQLIGRKTEFASSLDQRASLRAREMTSAFEGPGIRVARRMTKSLAMADAPTVVRHFEVGLSQDDAPHAKGGWVPAVNVACNVSWEADRLIFDLFDNDWKRRSKLQMTISIEDLPEIRVPLPMFADGISVALSSRWDGENPDLGVEIAPKDKRLGELVAALAKLSDEETIEVLEWAAGHSDDTAEIAEGFLYRKRADNWGAVLAALVLVRAGEYGRAQWVYNLAKIAPHIPDAGIAAAWVRMAVGEEDDAALEQDALQYLKRASWARQPAFSVANSLNLELLNSLRHSATKKSVRTKADELYRRALEVSRTRLFQSQFMIWEDIEARSKGRLLAPDIYTRLAAGTVSDAGLQQ